MNQYNDEIIHNDILNGNITRGPWTLMHSNESPLRAPLVQRVTSAY